MTDQEIIDNMRLLLNPINKKMEIMENHMAKIEHDISNLKLEVHQGFRKNDDQIETLIAVLEAKGILPKAQ